MIIVATFLPHETGGFALAGRTAANGLDMVGIHFILRYSKAGTDQKILAVGLGTWQED